MLKPSCSTRMKNSLSSLIPAAHLLLADTRSRLMRVMTLSPATLCHVFSTLQLVYICLQDMLDKAVAATLCSLVFVGASLKCSALLQIYVIITCIAVHACQSGLICTNKLTALSMQCKGSAECLQQLPVFLLELLGNLLQAPDIAFQSS